MFCKWCGKRIEDNAAPCPHCGKDQTALTNGNGFWDLCKAPIPMDTGSEPVSDVIQDSKVAVIPAAAEPEEDLNLIDYIKENGYIPAVAAITVVMVALIVATIILGVKLVGIKNENAELSDTISMWEDTIADKDKEIGKLSKELADARSEIEQASASPVSEAVEETAQEEEMPKTLDPESLLEGNGLLELLGFDNPGFEEESQNLSIECSDEVSGNYIYSISGMDTIDSIDENANIFWFRENGDDFWNLYAINCKSVVEDSSDCRFKVIIRTIKDDSVSYFNAMNDEADAEETISENEVVADAPSEEGEAIEAVEDSSKNEDIEESKNTEENRKEEKSKEKEDGNH